jgi:hypothetical protein
MTQTWCALCCAGPPLSPQRALINYATISRCAATDINQRKNLATVIQRSKNTDSLNLKKAEFKWIPN